MKAVAIIHEKRNKPLFLDEININDPKKNEIIVKMISSGICGSQLLNIESKDSQLPQLLGHEGRGIAIKVGSGVKNIKEGDHVLISPLPYTRNKKNNYAQLTETNWRNKTIKAVFYTWATSTIIHKQFVYKVDKKLEKYKTSIIGCACVSGYGAAMNCVKIKKNSSVVVFGTGGVGIYALNAASVLGAYPIIAIDLSHDKLKFAKKFGATHIINSNDKNLIKKIYTYTGGRGADFVFDVVGSAKTINESVIAAKRGVPGYEDGGKITLIGANLSGVNAKINFQSVMLGSKTYIGARQGNLTNKNGVPFLIKEYKKGKLLVEKGVTASFKLSEINKAIRLLKNGKILGRAIIKIS